MSDVKDRIRKWLRDKYRDITFCDWDRVAVHEAGHAVAMIVGGHFFLPDGVPPFSKLEIGVGRDGDVSILGGVHGVGINPEVLANAIPVWQRAGDNQMLSYVQKSVLATFLGYLGGPHAEYLIHNGVAPPFSYDVRTKDLQRARQMFELARLVNPNTTWAEMVDDCHCTIDANRTSIRQLATALKAKRKLSFEEAIKAIAGTSVYVHPTLERLELNP